MSPPGLLAHTEAVGSAAGPVLRPRVSSSPVSHRLGEGRALFGILAGVHRVFSGLGLQNSVKPCEPASCFPHSLFVGQQLWLAVDVTVGGCEECTFPLHLVCVVVVGKLEKAMAPLSRMLAWRIPWTEEPGRL